jgi:capsular exopolysaccharide synthesis family protein
MESAYLAALMGRRNQLTTELMLLDAQYPVLKDANAVVIGNVNKLTQETGAIEPVEIEAETEKIDKGETDSGGKAEKPRLPDTLSGEKNATEQKDTIQGWRELRVRLAHLQQREKDLAENLKPEHPELRAAHKEIENIQKQLEVGAEIELGMLKDRHKALEIQLNALEAAEYKWQAKNLLASQRRAELKRIASVVGRFEGNYNLLYGRLHDMRVAEELKAEHFRIVEPVSTDPTPVWPDPMKILITVLAGGFGAGFGLALVAQIFDNKVQSINDVEKVLGIPFLGGVPYWVHSGLEKTIRPIVTEEHSTGAIEAYRALRTSLLAALAKVNEKIVFITSADSKEGKTLTALNLAIMVAQMHKKVLLVDMDIRRGRLHRSLGLDREPGVTDSLREHRSLKQVIVPTRFENLFLAPTGGSVENSAELLQSSDIVGLFVDVQDEYDYIIVDSSPVLRVTDTVIVVTHGVGVVVYVARVNRTPKPLIRYSLDMLKDAHVLGLILNSIEMHRISSLYYTYQYPNYAYYSNAYAYGYDYYDYGEQEKVTTTSKRRRSSWDRVRHDIAQWLRRTFLPMD